jgi:molecular chaperone DnaK
LKTEVEQAVNALKEAVKGEATQLIRDATSRLAQVAARLAEAVHSGPTQPDQGSAPRGDPNVVDAEFEEVDKRDRKTG